MIKEGAQHVLLTVDGDELHLTPIWSSIDGESIRLDAQHAVNLAEADADNLASLVAVLLTAYRALWPSIPEVVTA